MRSIRFSALLAAAALSGCVAASNGSIQSPGGQTIRETKCNGSPNGCFNKAAQICKGTYQVVDSSSNAGGLIADILPGPITWYRMSFVCGKSDGRMPAFPFRGQQYTPPPIVLNQPVVTSPRTCTSTVTGTFVGAPNQINTTCY
jgi:hypothetical protein